MKTVKIIHQRFCSVKGCESSHYGRDFCCKHYKRWWRYGDPYALRRRKKCKSYTKEGISYIELTKGYWAQCSPYDLEHLLQWVWCANVLPNYIYPMVSDKKSGGTIKMSRVIAERMFGKIPKGKEVDHIDRNPLDNQRENLRLANHSENMRNMSLHRGKKSSRYKGVCFRRDNQKWSATIEKDGKQTSKHFSTEKEAAEWYNQKALELFREFACFNEI